MSSSSLRSHVLLRVKRQEDEIQAKLKRQNSFGSKVRSHISSSQGKPKKGKVGTILCCVVLFICACFIEYLILTTDLARIQENPRPLLLSTLQNLTIWREEVPSNEERHGSYQFDDSIQELDIPKSIVSKDSQLSEHGVNLAENLGANSPNLPVAKHRQHDDLILSESKGINADVALNSSEETSFDNHMERESVRIVELGSQAESPGLDQSNQKNEEVENLVGVQENPFEEEEKRMVAKNEQTEEIDSREYGQDVITVEFNFHRIFAPGNPLMSCNLTDEEIMFALNKMEEVWWQAGIKLRFNMENALQLENVSTELENNFEKYLKMFPKDDRSGLPWTTRNKGNLGRVARVIQTTVPALSRWSGSNIIHTYGVGVYVGYNGLSFNSKIYIRTRQYHRTDSIMGKEQFGRILAHEIGHRLGIEILIFLLIEIIVPGLHHPQEKSDNLMVQQRNVPANFNPVEATALNKVQISLARQNARKLDIAMDTSKGNKFLGLSTEEVVEFYQPGRLFLVPELVQQDYRSRRVVAVRFKLDQRKKQLSNLIFHIVAISANKLICTKRNGFQIISSFTVPSQWFLPGSGRHFKFDTFKTNFTNFDEDIFVGVYFSRKVGMGIIRRKLQTANSKFWPCKREKSQVPILNLEFSGDNRM